MTTTIDGVVVEPLYTEAAAAPVAQRRTAGWQALALVDPRRGPVATALERARRFGADGVWLRPSEPMTVAEVLDVAGRTDGLSLSAAAGALDQDAVQQLLGAWNTDSQLDLGWDPLSAAMRRDDWSPDAEAGYETAAALLERAVDTSRPGRLFTCSSLVLHAAGGDPVDELALLACGWLETLRRLRESGHDAAALAQGTLFEVGVGSHLLIEIAKLRAAREVLARALVAEGVEAEIASGVKLQAVTSPRTLTVSGHRNNILRATGQALAAVLGDADRLVVLPWDERLIEPCPGSDRLALQLHNVLRHEARLGEETDVGGGSFAIDGLTEQIGREAWELLHVVEDDGGAWLSLRDGTLRRRAGLARQRRGRRVEAGQRQVVGVNVHPDPQPASAARGHGPSGEAYAPFFDEVLPGGGEEE